MSRRLGPIANRVVPTGEIADATSAVALKNDSVRIKLKLHQKEAELHLLHSLKLGALQRELEERELEAELKEQKQTHETMHDAERRTKLTLEKERDEKVALIEAERQRVSAADERTALLSVEIEKLRKKNTTLRSEWQRQHECCQGKRKTLETKAEDTRYMLNDARARDDERQAVVRNLLARVAALESENEELQQIINRCEEHVQQHLDTEHKTLEHETNADTDGDTDGMGAPQRVAAAVQALQWILKGKKNEVKKAQAELAVVEADERAETAQLDALKKQHAAELADAKAAEAALEKQVRELEAVLVSAQAEEVSETKAVAELEAKLKELAAAKQALVEEEGQLNQQCAELEKENDAQGDVEANLKAREAELEALAKELKALQDEDQALTKSEDAQKSTDEAAIAELNAEIATLTSTLSELAAEEDGKSPVPMSGGSAPAT